MEPTDPEQFRWLSAEAGSNALSLALKASLRDQPIELKFYVHVFRAGVKPKGLTSLIDAVEDATRDWRALGAEKVHVANIKIGEQDPTTLERLNQAETARFSPWHALSEHRPLGSLNRARLAAYRASQRYRTAEQQQKAVSASARAAE